MRYKLFSKYPTFYRDLETALEHYADEHDITTRNYKVIAREVLNECKTTFSHVPNGQQRVVEFLQGVGLNIAIYNSEIFEHAYADKLLDKDDSDKKHYDFLDRYWKFMAMRLKAIAELKEFPL